jgi:hypothetical protein
LAQKNTAAAKDVSERTIPNSSMKYLVCPVSLVSGVKNAWIKRL